MRELRRRDLLLVALTFAAGSVDAVALLRLDVFTAVMTGNIVLLGLAVGQGAFGNALRSLVALVAYGAGVVAGAPIVGAGAATLIAFSGVAMGIQAATARALAPGMSTTYVTGTLTGLLSELSALGAVSGDRRRRASIVGALALGAVAGAFALSTVPAFAPAIPLAAVGGVVVAATRFR